MHSLDEFSGEIIKNEEICCFKKKTKLSANEIRKLMLIQKETTLFFLPY